MSSGGRKGSDQPQEVFMNRFRMMTFTILASAALLGCAGAAVAAAPTATPVASTQTSAPGMVEYIIL
jgi:hypothetical protein